MGRQDAKARYYSSDESAASPAFSAVATTAKEFKITSRDMCNPDMLIPETVKTCNNVYAAYVASAALVWQYRLIGQTYHVSAGSSFIPDKPAGNLIAQHMAACTFLLTVPSVPLNSAFVGSRSVAPEPVTESCSVSLSVLCSSGAVLALVLVRPSTPSLGED